MSHNLLPIKLIEAKLFVLLNYWLEYLDLLFFYKCKSGIIQLNLENYVKYCNSKSRRGSSGLYLRTAYFKTSLFRDLFFIRLSNIWNAVPCDIKAETTLSLKLSLSLSILLGYTRFLMEIMFVLLN